jgi:hypothetical protein
MRSRRARLEFFNPEQKTVRSKQMFATVRRYEGIDVGQKDELTKKIGESLAPKLSKLPGFNNYFLIDTGNGVMSSIGLFDTSTQASESTRVASEWVRDEKLERILPYPPKVTEGEVIVHKTNGAVRA